MEFPKTASELGIWLAMQFPVLGAAALLAYWAVRYTERLHEKRLGDARQQFESLGQEKEKRLQERDSRIGKLEQELAELKTKLSRSRKPSEEPRDGKEFGGGEKK